MNEPECVLRSQKNWERHHQTRYSVYERLAKVMQEHWEAMISLG